MEGIDTVSFDTSSGARGSGTVAVSSEKLIVNFSDICVYYHS